MKRVGVAELKSQLSRHLRAVEAGSELEVTDHDRPIARIVPIAGANKVTIRPPTRQFAELRDRFVEPADWLVSSTELLLEDRARR